MNERHYADWLKAQFVLHKDKSKADLARALGLEPPAISKILNRTRQIKAHEYVIMRQFFGLPVNEEPTLHPTTSRPLDSYQEQLTDSATSENNWSIPSELQSSSNTSKTIESMVVSDHLMNPDFVRDEVILVDTNDKTPQPAGVFVVSDKFTPMVRHCELLLNSKAGDVKITALDTSFEPQILKLEDFEILGRVVGKVQWLEP